MKNNQLKLMGDFTGFQSRLLFSMLNQRQILTSGLQTGYLPLSLLSSPKMNQQLSSLIQQRLIEPDFRLQTDIFPNDPKISSQWAVDFLNMTSAWDKQTGNQSIKVAVVDTGVDYTHPDLSSQYIPLGYDWVNGDSDPMDDQGHGTHVAGTIAATLNNSIGVAGMANISIFAEKIISSANSGTYADAILAIRHAADQGADIISNSWGGDAPSQLMQDAINYAVQQGSIVVAAAGNSNSNLAHYPAALDHVIGVSALDSDGSKASYSNYGNYIDIAAPGTNILSTLMGGGYGYKSGTSMATPHVSGILALLKAAYPNLSSSDLTNKLLYSASDRGMPGIDGVFGWGILNPVACLSSLPRYDVAANLVQTDQQQGNRIFSVQIDNQGSNTVTHVNSTVLVDGQIYRTDSSSSINPFSNYSYSLSVSDVNPGQTSNITVIINPYLNETDLADNSVSVIISRIAANPLQLPGEAVDGMIPVVLQVDRLASLQQVDYYLNGNYVTVLHPIATTSTIYLPLFQNGTNQISLRGIWVDQRTLTNFQEIITVESDNVINLQQIQLHNSISWIEDLGNNEYQDQLYTFTSILSESQYNVSIAVRDYTGSITNWEGTFWAVIDIRNSLIISSNAGIEGTRFQFLTNLEHIHPQELPSYPVPGSTWESSDFLDDYSIQTDQLLLQTSSVDGWSGSITFPQGYPLSRQGDNLQDQLNWTNLTRQSRELSWNNSDIYLSYTDTLSIMYQNTGDYVESVDSLNITHSGRRIPFQLATTAMRTWNQSYLLPRSSYLITIDPIALGLGESILHIQAQITANGTRLTSSTEIKVNVTDKIAPEISLDDKDPTIEVGTNYTLSINIGNEPYSEMVTVYLNGSLYLSRTYQANSIIKFEFNDFNLGRYNITAIFTDSSGNSASVVVILTVVAANQPNSSRARFDLIDRGYTLLIIQLGAFLLVLYTRKRGDARHVT